MRTTTMAVRLAALYLAAALLAAGAAELVLRRNDGGDRCLAAPRPEDDGRPPPAYARLDAELGWVAAPREGEINAQGFRDPRPFDAASAAASARRVVVLGDSFMWGAGVEPHETVPRQLERRLGHDWSVFNVSAPGWGLDQMYLAWRRHRDVLRPEIVVLAFIDDDVHRVLLTYRQREALRKPTLRLEGDVLVPRGPDAPPGPIAAALETSVLWRCVRREVGRATTARTLARHIIRTIADDAAARGARLVILRIPDREIAASPLRARWWSWRGFADAAPRGAYVEPLPELAEGVAAGRSLYVDDGHLSAEGAAVVAARLATALAAP